MQLLTDIQLVNSQKIPNFVPVPVCVPDSFPLPHSSRRRKRSGTHTGTGTICFNF
jgi:hypothetical protein